MRGEYIFDLPIYRCTKERHDAEMETAVEATSLDLVQ
jgi:hypothetical protein